jgi:predicted amidophosphoribosyltransferase
MAVGVDEASEAYQRAMRNIAPVGPGICPVCRTFIDPEHERCYPCAFQPDNLDAVVPITYSENLGQVHTALRNYKDGKSPTVRRNAAIRLAAILWRFLREHEACVAYAAGVDGFDLVTIVPSSNPQRDEQSALRELAGWIKPTESRMHQLLEPTGKVEGREFNADRFRPTSELSDESVLLLDDTWTTGGHARSASHALHEAGASKVALVVIGRHIRPDYEPVEGSGETCNDFLEALPEDFDWTICGVHGP